MENNTEPLISAVLPTYDRPDMLRGAVESVLAQTYSNIELVVVDDHSPTPAEEILPSVIYKSNSVRIIRHEENRGANVARNTGIENANGDYIAFLDDDDRWDPEKIERQLETFQRSNDAVGVVYTGLRVVNDAGTITSVHTSEVSGDVTKQLLCGARIATFSCVMVRSNVIQRAGLPDERFPCWQDREWYVRLSQHSEFESIPEPLVIRRVGEYDQIKDDYIQKREEAYPLFVRKHRSLAAEYGILCNRKMEASLVRKLGKQALRQQNYQESRKQLIKSAILYPFFWQVYVYILVSISGEKGHRITKTVKRMYERQLFRDSSGS